MNREMPNSEQLQHIREADEGAGENLQFAPHAWQHRRDLLALVDAQQEVLDDHRRLTAELDKLLNGSGAAQSPSLCDIVAQVAQIAKRVPTEFPP